MGSLSTSCRIGTIRCCVLWSTSTLRVGRHVTVTSPWRPGSTLIAQKQNGGLELSNSATEDQGWTRIGWLGLQLHKRGRSSSCSQASKACSGRGRFQKAWAIQRNYGGICRPWCEREKQSRRPLMNSPPKDSSRLSMRNWSVFDPRLHQLLHWFSTGHHANSAVWNSNLLMPLQFNVS